MLQEVAHPRSFRDEHQFHNHWGNRFSTSPVTRDELMEVLRHGQWPYSVASVIYLACRNDTLSAGDAQWLLGQPVSDFTLSQLRGYLALRDPTISSLGKLSVSLAEKADWAAERVLPNLDADERAVAVERVTSSGRPRGSKNRLLQLLKLKRRA